MIASHAAGLRFAVLLFTTGARVSKVATHLFCHCLSCLGKSLECGFFSPPEYVVECVSCPLSFIHQVFLEVSSRSCCVKRSFHLLVIFTRLMKRAHLSLCYNPQLHLAPYAPLTVSRVTLKSSSATMFMRSRFVTSRCRSSA
jgi:hypothetical protein